MGATDYNNLNRLQRAALREILVRVFTRAELRTVLNDIGKKFDNYTAENARLPAQVSDLINASQDENWTFQFIERAEREHPDNRHLTRLRITLGLAAPRLPDDGREAAGLTLERMIPGSGILDFSLMSALQGQVCRVEAGDVRGTGFLIADDLVLTNYHVIEKENPKDSTRMVCRFDYGTKGGAPTKGREVRLASDWLVTSAPYAKSDIVADGASPAEAELDFAVMRLAEAIGSELVNDELRGVIALSREATQLAEADQLFIMQHPEGGPLAMSFGHVIGYDDTFRRLRYSASTERGSSGSPIFTADRKLVALHHAGDPNWRRTAEYNQGIPIHLVAEHLERARVQLGPEGATRQEERTSEPKRQEPIHSAPEFASIVVLGEPSPPTPPEAADAMALLLKHLAAGVAPVSVWKEGWRKQGALTEAEQISLIDQRPAFIRTIIDQTRQLSGELTDLNYKLLRRFGLELDDESAIKRRLEVCPRILWRPGGAPWTGDGQPPCLSSIEAPESFARWLTALLHLGQAPAETVIHCELPPWDEQGSGCAQQVRAAVEESLIKAIGQPEADRQVFAPGRLPDVVQQVQNDAFTILALNDMSVPEPATQAAAIEVFRRSDRDIDANIQADAKLIRVAVLVRTADQFSGRVEFNSKARLRDWCLLRIPKTADGRFASDPDNIRFIQQQFERLKKAIRPSEALRHVPAGQVA